jgi:hypothetical protein
VGVQVVWRIPKKLRKEVAELDSLLSYARLGYMSNMKYMS